MGPGTCPHCGAPFSFGAPRCEYCGAALPTPSPNAPMVTGPPGSPDTFRLAPTTTSRGRGPAFGLGIGLIVFAVLLFVGAAVAQAGTQSFNQACAQNPLCTPAPDPAGGIAAGGAVVLVIGLVLLAYALSRGRDDG